MLANNSLIEFLETAKCDLSNSAKTILFEQDTGDGPLRPKSILALVFNK